MVIPSPLEVDGIMKQVPRGKLITTAMIMDRLAEKHGATMSCPLVTGISVKIAAFAAEERLQEGQGDMTPYWRTIKADGKLNEKFPGGQEQQRDLLQSEGHKVLKKGKGYVVLDYKAFLHSND